MVVLGQVDHHVVADGGDRIGLLADAKGFGGGECCGSGWDAFLASMRAGSVVAGQDELLEGDHVAVYLHKTSKDLPAQVGVLLAVSGEGADIDQAAHDVAVHTAAMSPSFLNESDVPEETVENEKRVAEETARNEGKPDKIIPNIVQGRLKGYYKDVVLLNQDFAKDSKKSVGQVLSEAGATATAFARFRVGA